MRQRQRGGAKINFLLSIIVLASLCFVAYKLIPAYFANYQLQDSVTSEARFAVATYPKKTPDDIQNDILHKAQDLGVPIKREDITVTTDGTLITISADYSITFDLAVYQFTHQFHLQADSHPI
ncbi:MAG: hypothetical protein WA192_05415 [Candidatus Acidiferrales bacterium]